MAHKIVISGASGFVGSHLVEHFEHKGMEVLALGRNDFKKDITQLPGKLEGAHAVIHLAGAPIIKRWTKAHKEAIYHSRVDTTNLLVEAIKETKVKPGILISTSAVGIYEDDKEHTEESEALSDGFMGEVCKDWEASALGARPYTQVAIFRLGIVLGKGGGALQTMLPLFKAGLGGKIGDGHQGFSWIHLKDLIRAYDFVMENNLDGVYNLTAPQPVSNAAFTHELAEALNRPAAIPVPEFGLKLLYGEGAQALTAGAFVRPAKLISSGFSFKYPVLKEALEDIV